MEMKNTFVELEQFEELTPEVLEEVNGGGIFEDIYHGYIYSQIQDSILIKMC